MPSYIILNIDTESPNIEIHAPRYTTDKIINTITIEADEELSDYQEIYVVDSNGIRHDYTFDKEDSKTLVGTIRFNNMPLGIVKINAKVKDSVGNESSIASKSIEIKESLRLLQLEISDRSMDATMSDRDRKTIIDNSSMRIDISDRDRYER